jgi:hypothetical protein
MPMQSRVAFAATCVAAAWILGGSPVAQQPAGQTRTDVAAVRVHARSRPVLRAAGGDANHVYGPPRIGERALAATAAPTATIELYPDAALQANPAAMAAFRAAADIWARTVVSPAPIRVAAYFYDMGDPNILGSAGPTVVCAAGSTYYAAALFDKLSGTRQCALAGGASTEIEAEFNSTFDWDFGTNGVPVPGKINFMTVVLHELGHGLGFFGSMNAGTTADGFTGSFWDPPIVYDRFAESGSGAALLAFTSPSALAAQLVSNDTFFDGAAARAGNGGNRPRLETHHFTNTYGIPSDNGFLRGSSYSHVDDVAYSPDGSGAVKPNGLMTFQLQRAEVYTDPGPIVRGMFQDMGWTIAGGSTPCTYSVTPATVYVPAAATSTSVSLTTQAGCAWTAASQDAFITLTSAPGGLGSAQVTFTVAANPTTASRTGSLLVGGQIVTVHQSAACAYGVAPASVSLPATASGSSITVTSPAGCAWTAASQSSFVTITSAPGGSGNGVVTFAVAANPTTAARSGTLRIAGHTIAVMQAGVPPAVPGDYDGDRAADLALFHPGDGSWLLRWSAQNFASGADLPFGLSTDKPVPGDYDGDGRLDMAVYRPSNGIWYVIYSSTGALVQLQWGTQTDVPKPADYTGDGRTDLAVWRPATGVWFIFDLSTGTYTDRQWGVSSDVPLTGDFDGDRKADVAAYRPSTGVWWVFYSSTQSYAGFQWGISTDVPLPADYTGDGRTDLAVYRRSTGVWFVYDLARGSYVSHQWGVVTDEPAPRDYDGDGRADLAVWRPSTGTWFLYFLRSSTYRSIPVGQPGDVPIR